MNEQKELPLVSLNRLMHYYGQSESKANHIYEYLWFSGQVDGAFVTYYADDDGRNDLLLTPKALEDNKDLFTQFINPRDFRQMFNNYDSAFKKIMKENRKVAD